MQKQLLKFVDKEQKDWDVYLDAIVFSYHVSRHDSTKQSPFVLEYGRQPRLPIEFNTKLASSEDKGQKCEGRNVEICLGSTHEGMYIILHTLSLCTKGVLLLYSYQRKWIFFERMCWRTLSMPKRSRSCTMTKNTARIRRNIPLELLCWCARVGNFQGKGQSWNLTGQGLMSSMRIFEKVHIACVILTTHQRYLLKSTIWPCWNCTMK